MNYSYDLKCVTKKDPNEVTVHINLSSKSKHYISRIKGKTNGYEPIDFLQDLLSDISEAIVKKVGVVVPNTKVTTTKNGLKLTLTTVTPQLYQLVLRLVFRHINNYKEIHYETIKKIIGNEVEKFQFRWRVASVNTRHIINYALKTSLKVEFLGANVIMIGQGAYAETFDSTSTFALSNLGAKICKNKILSNSFLSRIGLPVIDMMIVGKGNFKDKIENTEFSSLMPLVVKPSDQDRGIGITTNIYSKDDLVSAIEASFMSSDLAIIQKQIEGDTFRINTFCGEVVSVIQRSKATIFGDGISQISTLIDKHLQSREYQKQCERWNKKLISRDAALLLIERQGYLEFDVLEKGLQLNISETHNANSGASSSDVPGEKLHPSFLEASRLIAKSLRLDFLGVDWIASDITSHWKDNGAKILELNTQPQIGERDGGKTYERIMRNLNIKNLSIFEVVIGNAPNLQELEVLVMSVIEEQNLNKTGIFVWLNGIGYIYNEGLHEYVECTRERFEKICTSRNDCYASIVVLVKS